MVVNEFYHVLPSNSSMNYFPANSLTRFTTRLPRHHDLHGQWEVGLVEMQYPHNWYNIPERSSLVKWETGVPLSKGEFHLEQGYYENPGTLLNAIRDQINANLPDDNHIEIYYFAIRRKVYVRFGLNSALSSIDVGPHVQRLLGLSSSVIDSRECSGLVDIDPIHDLYVYCDLVEPRVVGDKMAPLLRSVPVLHRDGNTINEIFENVHYVPVSRTTFDTIEIDIRDSTGESIPFEGGTLKVTLHFRRRRNGFLSRSGRTKRSRFR